MEKKLYTYCFYTLWSMLLSFAAQGQVMLNDQFVSNPVLLNPAASGEYAGFTFQTFYRQQWAGFVGAPRSFALSIDHKIPSQSARAQKRESNGLPLMGKWALLKAPKRINKKKTKSFLPPDSAKILAGVGLQVASQSFGLFQFNSAQLNIAAHINLYNQRFLSLGFQAGVLQSVFDFQSATLEDERERGAFNFQNGIQPLIGGGIYYYAPRFWLGVSATDFGANNNSFFSTPTDGSTVSYPALLSLQTGYRYCPTEQIEVIPLFNIYYSSGFAKTLTDFQLKGIFNQRYMLGAGLRNTSAFTLLAGLRLSEKYNFNYAYTQQSNLFEGQQLNTHELAFSINLSGKMAALTPIPYRWK